MARTNGQPTAVAPIEQDIGGGVGGELLSRGKAMQRMDIGGYHTAISVQKERNNTKLTASVVEEASLLGEDFLYGWEVNDKNSPNGKGWIEGVSIDGAMILARNFGNCATPVKLVEDAPTYWLFEATFVDLEKGYTVQRLFRQRKSESGSKSMEADRKLDIAFQIGQSKAQRNVIVKAMPAWLINAAKSAALNSTCARFEKDLPKFRAIAVKHFENLKVTQAMLEKKVGLPIDAWTARDLAKLSSLHKAIVQEKIVTVDEAFAEETPAAAASNTPAASGEVVGDASKTETAVDPSDGFDDTFGGNGNVGG